MKRLSVGFILLFIATSGFCQSYNTETAVWVNYLIRMYENSPFEGVRVVDDYSARHLISVVAMDMSKYNDPGVMNRVASVKAMDQVNAFFNGSNISSDLIIRTSEKSDGSLDTETIENIKSKSVGNVRGLQQLTNFKIGEDGKMIFIFSCEISEAH